jgi:hypothetical protein
VSPPTPSEPGMTAADLRVAAYDDKVAMAIGDIGVVLLEPAVAQAIAMALLEAAAKAVGAEWRPS